MKTLWIGGLFLLLCVTVYSSISETVIAAPSTQVLTTLYSHSYPHTLAAGLSQKSGKNRAGPARAARLADYIYLHQTRPESHSMADASAAASSAPENQTPQL